MSVETEPLKLAPHRIEVDTEGHWQIVRADGARFFVPGMFQSPLRMVQSECSIASLAQALRGVPGLSFRFLAQFLIFINDRGLFVNPAVARLAEALRPDSMWRQSIAFEELAQLELFRLLPSRPWHTGPRLVLVFFLVTIAMFTVGLGIQTIFNVRAASAAEFSPATFTYLFFVAFFIGRSLRAVAQLTVARAFTGQSGKLSVRLDWVSISLATDDPSRLAGSRSFAFASALPLFFLFSPVLISNALAQLIGQNEANFYFSIFVGLIAIVELSPFRQSALTEFLRLLYVSFDRFSATALTEENSQSSKIEQWIVTIHRSVTVAWLLGFGFFLAGPFRNLLIEMRTQFTTTSSNGRLVLAAVAFALLVILLSFIEEAFSAWFASGPSDTRSVRRYWRRKRKNLPVPEAIQIGGKLSRSDLEALPLVRQLDPKIRASLLDTAEVIEIEAGETICREGDNNRTLYVVLTGQVAVSKRIRAARRKTLALLSPGAVFGEVAFFLGERRTADVHAASESLLLAIQHDQHIHDLDPGKADEMQLRIRFLQALVGSQFFKQIPSDALDALIFSGQRRSFRAGEKVFSEGERGDACYFIIQGQASVVQNQVLINRMSTGDAFGEIAVLMPNTLRTATVVADTDLLTVSIDSENFWLLLAQHLPLALEIEELARRRLFQDRLRAEKL